MGVTSMSLFRIASAVLLATAAMTSETGPAFARAVSAGAHSSPLVATHTVAVDGINVFYREAGDPRSPAILLLHGFPASSFMYRNLIPLLADRYHVIAPDLPGFGFTEAPQRGQFKYTFDNLACVIDDLTHTLGLDRFAIYVFD